VERVEVTTVVYADRQRVYEFLLDFPGYAAYSEYLEAVDQRGDGGPGTRYDLRFAWWKLAYTARSAVTAVDPPSRIDWRITKDIDAEGYWQVTPAASEGTEAMEIILHIEFDPDSASAGAVDLPRLVSMEWVIEKVKPLVRTEAASVVTRVVEEFEGDRRDVDVEIRTG